MAVGDSCAKSWTDGAVVCLLGLVLCAGCQDENWVQVGGRVTLQGEPVGPGTIMFHCLDARGGEPQDAVGHFGDDGQYTLRSAGKRKGAAVGKYRVTIHAGGEDTFGDENANRLQSKIPARYASGSGLTATVAPGRETVDFDLDP